MFPLGYSTTFNIEKRKKNLHHDSSMSYVKGNPEKRVSLRKTDV